MRTVTTEIAAAATARSIQMKAAAAQKKKLFIDRSLTADEVREMREERLPPDFTSVLKIIVGFWQSKPLFISHN
jgi:hypothetical protein